MTAAHLPCKSVEQVPPGSCATGFTHAADGIHVAPGAPRPGDFILTHGEEWTSRLIRFGQSLRYRGASAKYTHWNHTAIVVDDHGAIVEALGNGMKQRAIHDYDPTQYTLVRIEASDDDRTEAAELAKHRQCGVRLADDREHRRVARDRREVRVRGRWTMDS